MQCLFGVQSAVTRPSEANLITSGVSVSSDSVKYIPHYYVLGIKIQ